MHLYAYVLAYLSTGTSIKEKAILNQNVKSKEIKRKIYYFLYKHRWCFVYEKLFASLKDLIFSVLKIIKSITE